MILRREIESLIEEEVIETKTSFDYLVNQIFQLIEEYTFSTVDQIEERYVLKSWVKERLEKVQRMVPENVDVNLKNHIRSYNQEIDTLITELSEKGELKW